MSELKRQIGDAVKDAMRSKQKQRLMVLRGIMAEFKRVEVDERIELDDNRVLAILDKMSKQRRDSLAQFEEAGRDDLAEVERQELEVIKTFLPQPLTQEEVAALIESAIEATGATGMADMGKLMGALKPELQGRADMGEASKMIKQRLSQGA